MEYAKTGRIDKQYSVTSAPVRDDVVALIQTTESFNAELLDVIDRLTNEKIEKFRKKFNSLIYYARSYGNRVSASQKERLRLPDGDG